MSVGESLKKYKVVLLCGIGLLLILLPGLLQGGEEAAVEENEDVEYYSEMLEKKLEELLEVAKDVGTVRVAVTLDCSDETVYASNKTEGENSKSAEYVIIGADKEEGGIKIKEIYPKVRGVAVVCDGGGNIDVKKRVIELVSAALGLPASKIAVSG